MSSNFEWQNFQTGERMQARRREAEAYRRARQGKSRPGRALPLFSLAFLIGIALIVVILAGCAPVATPLTEAPATNVSAEIDASPPAALAQQGAPIAAMLRDVERLLAWLDGGTIGRRVRLRDSRVAAKDSHG